MIKFKNTRRKYKCINTGEGSPFSEDSRQNWKINILRHLYGENTTIQVKKQMTDYVTKRG